jgi:hypothetical protein
VDGVHFTITSHSDMPSPETIEDGAELWLDVGARVDRDAVRKELSDALRGEPHALADRYSEFSWGASGAAWHLFLEVSTAVGGVAGVLYVLDRVQQIANREGWTVGTSLGEVREAARGAVADCIQANRREVTVEDVRLRIRDYEVICSTPVGRFLVRAGNDGIRRVSRLPSADA